VGKDVPISVGASLEVCEVNLGSEIKGITQELKYNPKLPENVW
jgi:hypothetical protein